MVWTLPHVTEAMLHPEYWIERLSPADDMQSTWTPDECNKLLFTSSADIMDLVTLAFSLRHASDLAGWVSSHVRRRDRDTRTLYNESGEELGDAFWTFALQNAEILNASVPARPGFAVRRADVRRWPTGTRAYRDPSDREFDQFQETALHTFEPVVVVGESHDHEWYFTLSSTYQGWVNCQDLALSSWEQFEQFSRPNRFLLVTGPSVYTQAQPYDPTVSRKPVEFAAYIPLADTQDEPLGNQSFVGNFRVHWPVRSDEGHLEVRPAFIRRQPSVQEGFLPFRRSNVIRTAFQLLGERYGWGDSFGTHDCSSFVRDTYRTVGVQLPRDADDQENAFPDGSANRVVFSPDASLDERISRFGQLKPGDPLYMEGHTMLYLGKVGRFHYMIHDFAGYALNDGSAIKRVPVNEVMVSSLEILTSAEHTFMQVVTGALNLFRDR